MPSIAKWPKVIPPLTPEQTAIADDFMKFWHDEILPKRYGFVEAFNHRYPAAHAPPQYLRTLEVGAGLGEHIKHESLTPEQECNYVALELRQNMADAIKTRFPRVVTRIGNVEAGLDYPDGHFDRVIAIHVLEHLPDLPKALAEIRRLLDAETGRFSVVIPCEGGLGYALARKVSSQRVFEKRYNSPYKWFIAREHVNTAREVLAELDPHFVIRHRAFFPLLVPSIDLNLNIGLTLSPRR